MPIDTELASGASRRGSKANSGVSMSKPDPAGGSLEAILASIRKSLAEQSGEAAAEPRQSSEPEGDAKPARRHGLTERLAGASSSAPEPPHNSDDLSDLLENSGDSPLSAVPTNASPSQAASPAPEDPLWFLSRREEPKPAGSQSLLGLDRDASAAPPPAAPVSEPSLTRPEVLRASMPPFFGSSESTVTPPAAEAPAASSGQPVRSAPSNAAAAPAAAPPTAPAIEREVSLVAAAAERAAGHPVSSGVSGLNGATGGAKVNAAPGDAASNRALEAVVLELLKPMLRQWLDENMPRLVAQAISDEAVRARLPDGAKKP
jgi:uncharacterized protein